MASQTRLYILLLLLAQLLSVAICDLIEVDADGTLVSAEAEEDLSWRESCGHWHLQQESIMQNGQHLLCIVPASASKPAASGGISGDSNGSVHVSVIRNSLADREYILTFTPSAGTRTSSSSSLDEFMSFLHLELGTTNNRAAAKWRAFSLLGTRIANSLDELIDMHNAVIQTNGQWLWPGVSIGHQQQTEQGYTLETISLRPLVFRVPSFLTYDECDYIRAESEQHMRASGTSKMDHDVDKPDTTWRTSTQHFLHSQGKPKIGAIDKRVSELTNTMVAQQEYVQVLRYKEGEKYDQHHDYFNAKFYQNDPVTLANIKHGEKNRLATVLWYLTSVGDGGHTIFPLANGNAFPNGHNFSDCTLPNSLLIQPVKGVCRVCVCVCVCLCLCVCVCV